MVVFGFSDGSINLISSHNSSGILDSWKILDSIIGHTYEQDSLKLYVYLFLGWLLSAFMNAGWRFVVENAQLADSMKCHNIPDNLIDIRHVFYGSNGQLLIGA